MVALHAILDPKDEVIFPAPYWVSYPGDGQAGRRRAGAGRCRPTARSAQRSRTSTRGGRLLHEGDHPQQPEQPERRRCTPTSSSRGWWSSAQRKDIWLFMDDTYNRLVFDGRKPTNCYAFTKEDVDSSKLLVVNCVSKMYAMTGFRHRLGASATAT